MKKLENKIAVITGGNSGIGLETAREFLKEGAKVAIVGRDEKTLKAAKDSLGTDLHTIKADVSKLNEIDKIMTSIKESFGRIDILFVNAGVAKFLDVSEVDEKFYDEMMAINLKGLYFTVQKAIPLLSKNSSVILTSSSLHDRGLAGSSVYAATKSAVRSLGRTLSADLKDRGIRVNVLSPGPIETPIFERMGVTKEALKEMARRVPLNRMGRSDEMAKVALFLASEDSSFLLGSEVTADGGASQL